MARKAKEESSRFTDEENARMRNALVALMRARKWKQPDAAAA